MILVIIAPPQVLEAQLIEDETNDLRILRINSLQVANVLPNCILSMNPRHVNGGMSLTVEGEPILSLAALMELNKQGIMVHTRM